MRLIICVATILFTAGMAMADTIGPNCSSCLGSTYTLQLLGSDPSTAANDWRVLVTVDATDFNATTPYDPTQPVITTGFLTSVAIDVNAPIVAVAPLVLGPSGWSTELGGTNSSGCSGKGGAWSCAEATAAGYMLPTGAGPYQFEFDITLASGKTPDLSSGASSVKAVYVDSSGNFIGQTSAPITLTVAVPEASTGMILITDLLGSFAALGFLARRRRPTV